MNNTTRRHPRTLQEAFGPYTSSRIETDPPPSVLGGVLWAIALAVSLVAVVLL